MLAKREKEVLSLMTEGLTNKEIADKLNLALNTVKFYNTLIYDKLGALNRAHAVMIYLKEGGKLNEQKI